VQITPIFKELFLLKFHYDFLFATFEFFSPLVKLATHSSSTDTTSIEQGSKLTFQPASQTGLIDCNFYQSAEKLFSLPHKQKIENNEKMEQNKMPFSLIKD
jgi:hypothetical protein